MDEWGWEQVRPWLAVRTELPAGPLFSIIDGATRGRPLRRRVSAARLPRGIDEALVGR